MASLRKSGLNHIGIHNMILAIIKPYWAPWVLGCFYKRALLGSFKRITFGGPYYQDHFEVYT